MGKIKNQWILIEFDTNTEVEKLKVDNVSKEAKILFN